MRSPHVTSLWPHLFTPFAQKMSEVLDIVDPLLLHGIDMVDLLRDVVRLF
jgi:hypothetical protein